jgi:hypothetical protein
MKDIFNVKFVSENESILQVKKLNVLFVDEKEL